MILVVDSWVGQTHAAFNILLLPYRVHMVLAPPTGAWMVCLRFAPTHYTVLFWFLTKHYLTPANHARPTPPRALFPLLLAPAHFLHTYRPCVARTRLCRHDRLQTTNAIRAAVPSGVPTVPSVTHHAYPHTHPRRPAPPRAHACLRGPRLPARPTGDPQVWTYGIWFVNRRLDVPVRTFHWAMVTPPAPPPHTPPPHEPVRWMGGQWVVGRGSVLHDGLGDLVVCYDYVVVWW